MRLSPNEHKAGCVPVAPDRITQGTRTHKNVKISHAENDIQASVDNVYFTQSAFVLFKGNVRICVYQIPSNLIT
jgi:hypothetical protein